MQGDSEVRQVSVETLDRLGEVLKGNGATLALKWRGDGWYVTEYDTDGLVGLWPPAATLGEAVGAYLEAKTP